MGYRGGKEQNRNRAEAVEGPSPGGVWGGNVHQTRLDGRAPKISAKKKVDVASSGMLAKPIRGCLTEGACSFPHSLHLCGCAGWLPLRCVTARRLHRRLACVY
jgi:hypothetical protein